MKLIGKSLKIEHTIIVLIATMFILAVSCITCNATEIVDSGECGESLGTVTWTLDDEGTLTITGNGKMGLYPDDYDVPWYKNREKIVTIIIEPGVSSIGKNAFYNCKNATSATIPDSVKSIGELAFSGCSSLTNINLPDNLNTIERGAFNSCTSLTNITIPEGVTSIEALAFRSCDSLESVTIPSTVTSIGSEAFRDCNRLTAVNISDLASWCGIKFSNIFSNPLHLGGLLYLNGEPLTDPVIPDGVEKIMAYAFYSSDINSITLPDSVTSIGAGTFEDCTNLNSITIPDSVTSIGEYAFERCSSLTSITIPDSVTSIGESAFDNCSSLTSITIPDSVTSIGESAFYNCSSLAKIRLSENITSIEKSTFNRCSSLTDIIIPDKVTSIGASAFYECSNLESITIPASLKTVGKYAFLYCNSLKAIYISDIGSWCGISYEGELRDLPLWQAHNLYLNGELVTDIVIPDGVTEIKSDVFAGCTSLTSVKIPDSVTSIGSDVFYQCTSLKSINLPDSVTELYGCFANCSSLTNVTLPDGITIIDASMFNGCTSLTSVTIPDNVTLIEINAFRGCNSLRSITIPDGVTMLGQYAFANCTSLTGIKLPASLTYLDFSVFKGCTGLTSIKIPADVTYIGSNAFNACASLSKITIYSKTVSIGRDAFKNCSNLTVYGYTGSTAETYANNNSIPFIAIDGDDPYDPGEQLDYLSQLKLSARVVADSDSEDESETKLIYKNGKYENEIPVTVKLYCNIPHNYVPSAEGSETSHQYTYDELESLGVTVNISDLKLSLDDSLADKCQIVFEDGSGGAGEAYYGETITVRPKDHLSIHATLRGKDGSAPAEITTENELNVAATYQVCAESGQATEDARSGGNVKFTTVNVDKGRETYAPSDFVKPSVRMMYTNIIASGRPANESTAVYKDGAFDHDSFTIKATLTVKNVENDFYSEQELNAAGVTYSADYLEFESSETRAVLSSGSQSGSDIKVYNSDFNNLKSGDSHEVPLTLKINESCLPNSAGDRMLVTAKILDKNTGKTMSCGTAKLNITNRDYTKRKIEEQKEDDPDNAELALRNALKVDKTINVANFPNLMFLSDSEQEAIERLLKIWLADIAVGFEMKENKSAFEKLEGYCTDKVFNKCMSYLNVDVDQFVFGAKEVKGETIIVVHTEEYGNVEALFELELNPFSASGSIFAATGTLKCTVYGDKITEDVIGTYNGIESPVTYMNTRALADHIKKMAIATAHSCYPSGLGGDIDAVVDETVEIIFKQPAYKALRLYGVSFPGTQFHAVINLMEEGYNEHLVRCPVDVYVYNSCGDLVGAIVDDVVDPSYDTVNMFVEDGEKKIILSDDDYHLKLTGNDDGTMDYDVTAYGADGSVKRQVQYRNVPITRGESWETNSPENPDAEQLQLSLISSEYGTVLKPDEDVKAEVEPEVYGLVLDACEKECPEGGTINIKATLISNVAAEDLPQVQDGIVWSSSNENAAVVNSKGEVTGKALGESIITASYGDGKFVARCLVKVVEKQDDPDEPHQHAFGPWVTTKAATEIAAGLQTRKCSECGYTERRTVAQLAPTLPAVKITKAVAGKKSATVKWKKISAKNRKKIKKVEIQYSTDRNFRTGVKTKYAGSKKTSYKIKGLKKGKKYYVRIRAYTKAGTTVHVSKWSKTKPAKVK